MKRNVAVLLLILLIHGCAAEGGETPTTSGLEPTDSVPTPTPVGTYPTTPQPTDPPSEPATADGMACDLLTLEEVQSFAPNATEADETPSLSEFADTCTYYAALTVQIHQTLDNFDDYFIGAEGYGLIVDELPGFPYPARLSSFEPDPAAGVEGSVQSIVLEVEGQLLIVSPYENTFVDTPGFEALKELARLASGRL